MRRDRAAEAEAAERQRAVRERLDATGSGLAELELLRQRQEELVRAALQLREEEQEERREAPLTSEEKLLEENILLLRKQLNCLRRRDAGLISQLQELDRQISDLRLDTEASHDPLETDSRPSSGFYELSDGASGSLSNSSNSVFSECFCSMAEADGRLLPADELGCLDCDGSSAGLWDDSSSCGTVRRSLSAPHPAGLDAVSVAPCDSQSRYHCDLVARNGSDVYRYPSPLHAVAVQSPNFLQMLSPGRDDGPLRSVEAGVEGLKSESPPASVSAPLVSQSASWPAPSSSSSSSRTPPQKRLDSYIFSLLQRRALPVRTSRPRTSISTDPSKSVLRQASLCVRQGSGCGLGTLRGSEFKPSWLTGGAASSPQRSVESKPEEQESRSADSSSSAPSHGMQTVTNRDLNTKQKSRRLPAASSATLPTDLRELGRPKANSPPKEYEPPCFFPDRELLKSPPVIKTSCAAARSPKPPQAPEKVDRSAPESVSLCSSSPSQEGEGAGCHMENAVYVPAQWQNIKLRKAASKTVMVKTTTVPKTGRVSEHDEVSERRGDKSRHRSGSKKSRRLEDGGSIKVKVSKRAAGSGGAHGTSSSRIKRLPASIPEGRVLEKNATSTQSSLRSAASRHHHHHHHHGRDQVAVVAKPKYKRNDYRRLRAIMEVPYDEAFRRAQRRQRKELLSRSADVFLPAAVQTSSPYACVAGSDSEYSAECASLFHSTIADTSEDERSNYTTNRFGDSESSEDEYVEESSTSDTEESGGGGAGGAGRGRSQGAPAGARGAGQEMTPAQAKAFVKIKASHNLKKKILRFRSGSLKLMTTV